MLAKTAHLEERNDPSVDRHTGRLPPFIRSTLGVLSRSRFRYDDVHRLRFREDTYLLTSPEDIHYVLVTNADNYLKTPHLTSARGRERAGAGLLTSHGEQHLQQRRALQPIFHVDEIQRFAEVILDRTDAMMDRWKDGNRLNIEAEMEGLTKSVILGILFGIDFEDEGGKLGEAIRIRRQYTEYVYHSHLPFRTRLPMPIVRRNRWAIAALDEAIYAAIEKRRNGFVGNDLVSSLIDATYPDGSRMNDRLLCDEIRSLTHTGYETIGDSLTWTWYLLMQNSDVQERLLDELNSVLCGRPLGIDDVPRLEYAQMVISESMRLFPPTWIYVRVPVASDRLPSGVEVGRGAKLYLCPFVMHRHPRFFPEPERFDPERFREGPEPRGLKYVYFPFGRGRHTCLGEQLARIECVLVLASVARRYRFDLVQGRGVVPKAGITLHPKRGLMASLHQRQAVEGSSL